jgi:signal transduction histidine kinase
LNLVLRKQKQLQQEPINLMLQQQQKQLQQELTQQQQHRNLVLQQQQKQKQDMQDAFQEMQQEMTTLKKMLQWPDLEPLQQQLLQNIEKQLELMQQHVNKMQHTTKQLQQQKKTITNAIFKFCLLIILIPPVLAVIGAILFHNLYVINPSTPSTWSRHTTIDANVQQKLDGLKQDFPR